jgi:hypothetical protein
MTQVRKQRLHRAAAAVEGGEDTQQYSHDKRDE